MGGMFGGGGSKKKSSDEKSTTADSIETADGTVYDRRGTTTAAAMTPTATAGTIPSTLAAPTMDPMEKVMSNRVTSKKQSPAGTLAGQSGYGFG
jgi:hypothetical protein